MRKFRPRRPSGAMLVASVALFVALGGSSYAALTITSANIKNGTIKGVDVHNSTITGAKLKKNTLTGTQINESRLGTVPTATNAANAANATNATNATNAANLGGLGPAAFLQRGQARADGFSDYTDIDNFTTAAFTEIASKTFTAPTAGFAYVVGNVSAADDATLSGQGSLFFELRFDGASEGGGAFEHPLSGPAVGNGNSGESTKVFAVSPGAHTVSIVAKETGTGTYIYSRHISILFVPDGSAS